MYVHTGLGGPTFGAKLVAVGKMAGAVIAKAQGEPDAEANFDQAQAELRSLSTTKEEAERLFVAGAKQAARTIEVNRQTERLVAETMERGPVQATGTYAQAVPARAGFFGGMDPLKLALFAGVGIMMFSLATAKPKKGARRAVRRPAFRR